MTYSIELSFSGISAGAWKSFSNQFDTLTITGGSADGIEMPQAATISATFLNTLFGNTDVQPKDLVGQKMQAKVTRSDGAAFTYLNFIVQSVDMEAEDAAGQWNILNVTAVGPLAQLGRQVIPTQTFTSAAESTMVTTISNAQDGQSWGYFNGVITWDLMPATTTWSNLDSNWIGVTSTGGTRVYEDISTNYDNSLSFFQSLAINNDAWIWEDPNGWINYKDRQSLAASIPPPTTINASTLAVGGTLSMIADTSNYYNDITINNITTSSYAGDVESIISDGTFPMVMDSNLANALDMTAMANAKLAAYANGLTTLSSLTFDLDLVSIAQFSVLTNVQAPKNLDLSGVPSNYLPEATLNANLWQSRGGTITFTTNHSEVNTQIVPYSVYASATTTWLSDLTSTWATYKTALTTWADVI